jgi:hypothetical protein
MKTIKSFIFLIPTLLVMSCSSTSSISNGAYSDISLNKNSNEYELKRLNPLEAEGKAFFGIPMKAKKKRGVVVRFNGINLGKSNQFLPILTMIGYSFGTGVLINDIVGVNNNGEDKLGLLPSIAIAIPIAGIINNFTWSGAAMQNASWDLNSKLLEENPDVDIFLNPKYEIETAQGVFTQKARVKARIMGATIKTD